MEFTVNQIFLNLLISAVIIGAIVSAVTEKFKKYIKLENIVVSLVITVFVTEVVIFASLKIIDLKICNIADHLLLIIVVWAGATAIYNIFIKNSKIIQGINKPD